MLYREIPRTGHKLSAPGLGTMRFKRRENTVRNSRRCLELGVNFIESAAGYGWPSAAENADVCLVEAISGWNREKLVILSKMQADLGDENRDSGLPGSTYDGAWQGIENSLTRVATDYLDFYLL
jgi:aryl-alcohol dehydrogenase-like predicted oxidoreductase